MKKSNQKEPSNKAKMVSALFFLVAIILIGKACLFSGSGTKDTSTAASGSNRPVSIGDYRSGVKKATDQYYKYKLKFPMGNDGYNITSLTGENKLVDVTAEKKNGEKIKIKLIMEVDEKENQYLFHYYEADGKKYLDDETVELPE